MGAQEPLYVWAQHDFLPEHDDEIAFRAGDRIEIVERDELYGDGWWQGRDANGKVGLFPEAYTTREPPALAHGGPLHALAEEPDASDGEEAKEAKGGVADGAKGPPLGADNSMAATLTDVQAAIEQLAVRGADGASRSFSFASTRTGGESESEPDADDEDGAWHRNTRTALAAATRAEPRESWTPAPPIALEMSDESEPEDDEHIGRGNDLISRTQSPPPSANTITFRAKSPQYVVPSPSTPGRTASPPLTATAASFRAAQTAGPLRSQTPRATSPLSVGPTSPRGAVHRPSPPSDDSSDQSPVIPPSDPGHVPPDVPAFQSHVDSQPQPTPQPTSQLLSAFAPAQLLAAALRSASPALRSPSPAIRSASPAVRAASPVVRSPSPSPQPAPSTASLPTPVTPTLSRSPAPSVLSFSSNRYVDRRSSSPYPPPTGELPAPPVNHVGREARSPTPSTYGNPALSKETTSPITSPRDFAMQRDFASPQAAPRKYTNTGASAMGLPSPATSASGIGAAPSQSLSPTSTRFRQASVASEASAYTPAAPPVPMPSVATLSADYTSIPPTEWTLPHVLAWLTAKGFDADVRRAFSDNDITGDVLLELDHSALKDELGIGAFGKRARIVKAVGELKRGEDAIMHPPAGADKVGSGTDTDAGGAGARFLGHAAKSSAGWSSSRPGSAMDMHSPVPAPASVKNDDDGKLKVRGGGGNRPTSLVLSPSDGALANRTLWDPNREKNGKDERGVLSEGETSRKPDIAKSKQFFDNQTPTTSKTDPSESGSTPISSFPPSPSLKRERWADKEKVTGDKDRLVVGAATGTPKKEKDDTSTSGHSKGKKSLDGSTNGGAKDRLSIFGNALGKGRKPAPRYSTSGDAPPTANSDDRSHRSLSRLYMSAGSQRRGKDRPSVPPSPSTIDNEARKRTISGPVGGMRSASPAGAFKPAPSNTTGGMRNLSPNMPTSPASAGAPVLKPGERAVDQIGEPDYSGWMRKKGDRYNSWKLRYFVLKGPHLYYLRSRTETKIKGYVNITGYKVIADENANPGRYGFRIVHDTHKPHFFSSEEQVVVREWMKALMKATIARNFNDPVRSSCNVPTIPLAIAQQMNPAPRPPSPSEREAAQRASRRENPNQLSSRDARILMGLPENGPPPRSPADQYRMNSFFAENGQTPSFDGSTGYEGTGSGYNRQGNGSQAGGYGRNGYGGSSERGSMAETELPGSPLPNVAPTRPSREMRPGMSKTTSRMSVVSSDEQELLEWVNARLPPTCPYAEDLSSSMASGLILFRLAEAIKQVDSGVPDSAFPQGPGDDRLDGMFKLFDFLLDNDVRMGGVSINDVRNGNGEKIAQLVRSLKVWEEKRRAGPKQKQVVTTGPWMAMTSY